ncbi:DUF7507 domain-containing protein [Spirosoma gilvum]
MANSFAQDIQFTNVSSTPTTNIPVYRYYNANDGSSPYWNNLNIPYYNFKMTVTGAIGAAAALNGHAVQGFCVNPLFDDPNSSVLYTYATDGSQLSYDLGLGDNWAVNRTLKFNAIKNIFATYYTQLATMDWTTQAYGDLSAAIGMAISEIVMDYDGTAASLDLNSGNSTITESGGTTPITSGNALTIFNTIKNSVINNGSGTNFTLYVASNSGNTKQDVIFFDVCPIPTFTQTAPTCTGSTANNNGKITLTAVSNADRYGVSTGSTYTGPAYASATTIGTLPINVQSNIPNTGGSYTIRLFNGITGCSKDTTITVAPVSCVVSPFILTAVPGPCNTTTNLYTVNGQFSFTNTGAGSMVITDGANTTTIPISAGDNYGTYSFTSLSGTGTHTVTATYAGQTVSVTYTAPMSCNTPVTCTPPTTTGTTICAPATTALVLPAAASNQAWEFVSGPANATITAGGAISGLTANGTYTFRITNNVPVGDGCFGNSVTDYGANGSVIDGLVEQHFGVTAGVLTTTNPTGSVAIADMHSYPYVVETSSNFNYVSGTAYPFTMVFNPAASGTNKFVFTINGTTVLQWDPTTSTNPTEMDINAIRIFGAHNASLNTRVLVDNLVLNGSSIAGNLDLQTGQSTDDLLIRGYSIANGFTLTGTAKFDWGNVVGNFDPTAQFRIKLDKTICSQATSCTSLVTVVRNAKPNAGTDQSICAPSTTANLSATPTGGSWTALGSNPASASVTNAGAVSGMTANGTYGFVYTLNGCSDTVQVVRSQPVSVSVTPGTCQPATNQYTVTGTVTLNNATAGTLTITDGSSTTSVSVAGGNSTVNFTFTNLMSDASSHIVTATLSSCGSATATYTAPASCSVAPCSLTAVTTAGVCASATNTYSATTVVTLSNPTAGVLTVTNGVQSLTFATTAVSSVSFTAVFNGLTSDGASHTVVASLPGCSTVTNTYTAPSSCTVGLGLSVTPGVCQSATNQYSISGTLSLTNAVAGTATITDGSSTTTVSVAAGATSVPYLLSGLNSDGALHTVTVSYAGKTASTTYTAPASCTVAIAVSVTPGVCQSATNQYSISGTLSLTNAVAGTATITDGASTTTVSVAAGATSVAYSLSGLTSDGASHTVTVSYAGKTASTIYTAPASCTVAPACGLALNLTPGLCLSATNAYVLSGTLTATNVPTSGTLTLSSAAFSSRTIALPVGNSSGTFSYSGLVSDGQTYTVTATYTNAACSPVSQTYTAPASCSVAPVCSLSTTATAGICASATNTYSASVVVSLANAPAGTLTISLPGSSPISQTIAAGTPSFTAVFKGLLSDGASHTATISLPGCGTTTANFTAPASCSVAPVCSMSAVVTAGQCASATSTYSATAVVTVQNPVAGSLSVSLAGVTQTFATTANAQNTFTAVFNGLTSDGASHTVVASLPGCSTVTSTYTAPASCSVAPVCSLSAVTTAGVCASATNTYSATTVVTLSNPVAGVLTVSNGGQSLTFTTSAVSSATYTAVFNGLVSDGASHTVVASLPGCSTVTSTYTAPASCSVAPTCGLSVTATGTNCNPATNLYVLAGSISLTNSPTSQTLTLTDGSYVRSLTAAAGTTTINFSYTTLQSDGAVHTVTVTSSATACATASTTYTAPASCSVAPVCSISAITTQSQCASATNTFSNTVTVSLSNPTAGVLTVTDGVSSLTFNIPATAGTMTTQAIFNGLVSGSGSHTVVASLPGCSTVSTTYTAPASCSVAPVCSMSAVVTAGQCASATNTYSATAVVTLTNPVAGVLTVLNGGQSLTFTTSAVSSATYTAVFNGLVSDGASHTVVASLPGCSTVTSTYTAPASCSVAPVCSLSAITTAGACASATNTYSATTVVTLSNPGVGVLTVTNGAQSLTFATSAVSSATYTAVFNGLTSDGASHTVVASLPGCSTITSTYTAPASCTVAIAVSVTPGLCQGATNQYSISGTLSLTNAVAGTATITDGSNTTTVSVTAGATSVAYSLTGLTSGTGSHTVTVSYAGKTASVTYTAPASCTVAPSLAMVVTPGVCNSLTNQYTVSGTLSLTNATAGTATITDGSSSTTVTVASGTSSVTFAIPGLTSGTGSHTVTVAYASQTVSATYTAPASCTVAPPCLLAVTVTPGVCNSATNQYSITGSVSATNAIGTQVITLVDGAASTTLSLSGNGPVSFTLTGLNSDGVMHTLTASAATCGLASTIYTAPTACTVAIAVSVTPGVCQSATNQYSISGTLSLTNAVAGTATISDGSSTTTVSVAAGATSVAYSLSGLTSDGASHTVTVSYAGKTASTTYTAPTSCLVTPVFDLALRKTLALGQSATVTTGSSVTFTITVFNQGNLAATNIQLTDYIPSGLTLNDANWTASGSTATLNSPIASLAAGASITRSIVFTVSSLSGTITNLAEISSASGGTDIDSNPDNNPSNDGAIKNDVINENGLQGGDEDDSDLESITVSPVCSMSAVVSAGQCASATNTYSATAVVTLNNPGAGVLTVTNGAQSLTFATSAVSSATYTAVFNGLISDGVSHTVVASQSGCSTVNTAYLAPASCTPAPQLTLDKLVDKSTAQVGDVLTYTLVLTNTSTVTASNVVVRDSSMTGLSYIANSATAPVGTTFTPGSPISNWIIPAISAGQSLRLTFQARADSTGILYNTATIPGDTAKVCTSVPVHMCAGDEYAFELTAPAGRSSYKWYRNGVEIVGATTNVLSVTTAGTYSLVVDGSSGQCPDFSCCPFIVVEDTLPNFKAKALPVSCVGNTAQSNGQIVLSEFGTGLTYQYSLGASFNPAASLSGAAKAIPGNGVIVSNLGNPVTAQAYTVRVYTASGCYRDVTVILMPTVCGCPADICAPYVIKQTKRPQRIGDLR